MGLYATDLGDLTKVTEDINLPTSFGSYSALWVSSNKAYLSDNGRVERGDVDEAAVLRESLDKISLLQSALDEEAIGVKWFWVTHNGVPIISHYKNPEFRDVIGFNTGHTLILKR